MGFATFTINEANNFVKVLGLDWPYKHYVFRGAAEA